MPTSYADQIAALGQPMAQVNGTAQGSGTSYASQIAALGPPSDTQVGGSHPVIPQGTQYPESTAGTGAGDSEATPGIKGTGVLNNPAVDMGERFIQTATPAGAIEAAVTSPVVTPGEKATLGDYGKEALNVAGLGASLIPGSGIVSDATSRLLLGGAAGAGLGSIAPTMAANAPTAVGLSKQPELDGPTLQFLSSIAGGMFGGGVAQGLQGAADTIPAATSSTFGALTPAQAQIKAGTIGLTPEIEREAMARSSNPIQSFANRQANSLQGGVNQSLGAIAPIQEPTAAAAGFQNEFGNALDTAKSGMSDLDAKINAYDISGQTKVNLPALQNSIIKSIRDAGWPVDASGKLTAGMTAPGYSPQAASVIQSTLDELPNVNSVMGLRRLRQNLGSMLDSAGQQSGSYAEGVKKGMYGALSDAEQSSLPPDLAAQLKQQNSVYSGLKGAEDVSALGKSLGKDPVKFWDSFLSNAGNDKDFMPQVQAMMGKTGMGIGDLQSVAVSNIASKVNAALNNPAADQIGRLTGGINALEKELTRIPVNSQSALLGDALPQLQSMVKDGQGIRQWANTLPNNSGTAVTMASQLANRLGNAIEGASKGVPMGEGIGGWMGSKIRNFGSMSNDAAMNNYLKTAGQAPAPVLQAPAILGGGTLKASKAVGLQSLLRALGQNQQPQGAQ